MDYEVEYELSCPNCAHSPLHYRHCTNLCDEGFFDESDEDPVNFSAGEWVSPCAECAGTGIERWCPECGANLSGEEFDEEDEIE